MHRITGLFLSLLFAGLMFSSCTKEYSEENGGIPIGGGGGSTSGSAVFTLAGAPGSCSIPTIAGTYRAGTLLNNSNSIILNVDVTTVGTYTVSTGSANGMAFSGSGTFTITGTQIITLVGSGTPVAAGTHNFTAGSNGCTFSITTLPASSGPVAEGTLDCANAVTAGVYTQGIDLTGTNTVTIPVNVTVAGSYSVTSNIVNGCTFSGSGTLAPGAQNIVLTGSGTPINSGAFTFNISLGTSSCGFSITFLPGVPPPTDFFRCKIDGVSKTFNLNLDGDPTPILLTYGVSVSGDAAAASPEYLDLTVNSILPIAAGIYLHPFGVSFSTSRYVDTNGDGWQPADNSSPAFSVVVTSISATRITGTFSGQYKNLNGTGTLSKQFTNGEFSVALP